FQSFSERISQIEVNVFHKVKHPYEEEDEENGTFYSRCLKRLKNDNFSAEFTELCKVLPHDVSLPELIVQKQKLVDILISHIKSCDLEALPPALELLVAIARDLGEDFYPFFHLQILPECVELLNSREPEQIECVFNCLAHLFKYLWVHIVRKISNVLPHLLPLLSSSRPKYINEFAAESFAFVARKELVGVARLFFEVIRSVAQQFHSCTEDFLTLLLEELDNREWSELLLIICENLISDITRFVSTKTDVSVIWKTFINVGNKFSALWVKHRDEHNACNLYMILKIAQQLVTSRELILRDPEKFVAFLLQLGKDPEVRKFNQLHGIIIDILSYILSEERLSLKIKNTTDIIMKIAENIDNEVLLVQFCEVLIELPAYEKLVFEEFLKWSVPDSFYQYLLDCIPDKSKEITSSSVEEILSAILILSGVEKCRESFCKKTDYAIAQLCLIIKDKDENEENTAKILYTLLMAYHYRSKCSDFLEVNLDHIFETAMKYVNSCNYLCSLRLLQLKKVPNDMKPLYYNRDLLINNLSSPFHKVRLFTLQVLAEMESNEVFQTMLNVEMIIPSIGNYREKLNLLQQLEYSDELASCSVAVMKFLFGNLFINFQYLWEPTQKLIKSHLENNQSIWPTVQDELEDSVVNILDKLKMMQDFSVNFEADCISEHFYELNGVDDRPDFYNFRNLLLESLLSASHVKFTSEYKTTFEYKTSIDVQKMDEELSDTENADTEDNSEKSSKKKAETRS
ncbi:unnamed protein product, partial [Ilex paraguariensis]